MDSTFSNSILERLSEEYVDRLRAGENPHIVEYQNQYPDLAEEIGELFPALRLLERGRENNSELASRVVGTDNATSELIGGKLGDFQIVREIGRGGMGVVYEAVQISLGRRVALKVIHRTGSVSEQFKHRFLREAKAAASLHHTNIVPVFAVGEQMGVHYYAMQHIDGSGLEAVSHCLREQLMLSEGFDSNSSISGLAASLAQGKFEIDVNHETSGVMKLSTGSSYWSSIAKIGQQAADALQYAHAHGVVHRDVKPANLLLDRFGNIWITDFGLAKVDDQLDLTHSGDILGTLRYMAPERFHGTSDSRSDIYSLGVTIYELLAMQPAFSGITRPTLIHQVIAGNPEHLSSLNPDIPRDLATIIHKAIDREPHHRYQSAGEMRDDLRRFLSDEPIRAKRMTTFQKTIRWSRRNPSTATLLALLILMGIVSPFLLGYFQQLTSQAQAAEREAETRLFDSLRSNANARRFSGRSGQHFETLESLRHAHELRPSLRGMPELWYSMQSDAVAAMALPDLNSEESWHIPNLGRIDLGHFDKDLRHYCVADSEGLSIRRIQDHLELSKIPLRQSYERARFSPNGERICLTSLSDGAGWVEVWDWRNTQKIYEVEKSATLYASDISQDGKWLAVGHTDGTVSLHDLTEFRFVRELRVKSPAFSLAFDPLGERLAITCESAFECEVWDLRAWEMLYSFAHPSHVYGLAWKDDGRLLAVIEGFSIYLWDVCNPSNEPWRILKGSTWVVSEVDFHPTANLLYSHSWREGRTRVWNLNTGRQQLVVDGFLSQISQSGELAGFRTPEKMGVWKIATGTVCSEPLSTTNAGSDSNYCCFDSTGRWLASTGNRETQLWDTAEWKFLARVPSREGFSVAFDPKDPGLFVVHDGNLYRYGISKENDDYRFDSPYKFTLPEKYFSSDVSVSSDGKWLITDLIGLPEWVPTGKAILFDRERNEQRLVVGHSTMRYISASPDGRRIAMGNWVSTVHSSYPYVKVWQTEDLDSSIELPAGQNAMVEFSPDNKFLATASISKLILWDTDTWQPKLEIPCSTVVGCVAFSPDGETFAASPRSSSLQLYRIADGRVLVNLTTNDDASYIQRLAFSPDGQFLAVSSGRAGLKVWDLRTLRQNLESIGFGW